MFSTPGYWPFAEREALANGDFRVSAYVYLPASYPPSWRGKKDARMRATNRSLDYRPGFFSLSRARPALFLFSPCAQGSRALCPHLLSYGSDPSTELGRAGFLFSLGSKVHSFYRPVRGPGYPTVPSPHPDGDYYCSTHTAFPPPSLSPCITVHLVPSLSDTRRRVVSSGGLRSTNCDD